MNKCLLFISFLLLTVTLFAQSTTINYQNSSLDFANPERGFYRYSATSSSNYVPLTLADLTGYRMLHQPNSDPAFEIYSTLVFRYFEMEDFVSAPISQTYLDAIEADFNTARLAGVKLIPRFVYTTAVNDTGCGSWICPPYGDADKTWVLSHLTQLQPILSTHKDVIAGIQMGLIGTWGENYYTDFFGDASQPPDYKLIDVNWQDRIDVLQKLLDVTPDERMVGVRYPQMKQRFTDGINAPTSTAPMALAEAYTLTDKSRIGFHNDCILASADDFGTFADYGNDSTPSTSDTTNLKPYKGSDSKYVFVGGETCSGYDPYDDCVGTDPDARADYEIRRFHYSYLNADYNYPDVNADWVGNCMDDIKKELGYRFVMQDGTFSDVAQIGQNITVEIEIDNEGYASPFNPRDVELLLRNTTTSEIWRAPIDSDPRFWFDNITINESFCVPTTMPTGTYEYLLNLPDPEPSIASRFEYSIRLANLLPDNSDVWESATGYNKLGHEITITSSSGATCDGSPLTSLVLLPVELIDFKAHAIGCKVVLNWATALEEDFDRFEIESSNDARMFSKIGNVNSFGSGSYYSFEDEIVEKSKYYRLKMIDEDGSYVYSNTIHVATNCGQDLSFWAYPNPAGINESIRISFTGSMVKSDMIISDVFGNEKRRFKINDNTDGQEFLLETKHLVPGVYIIWHEVSNKTIRFIISE